MSLFAANFAEGCFIKFLLSREDVEDALPLSVKVIEDLLQPVKNGQGRFGIRPLLGYPLDPGDLPGDEPLGVGDILLELSELRVQLKHSF